MDAMISKAIPLTVGTTLPDAALVRRVLGGDVAVFEILMRRHNPRVYRTIRAILRDEAEVEDAMQQAYLLAYANLRSFNGESAFATWLTRIALNEALGRRRRNTRVVPVPEIDAEDPTMQPRPSPEEDTARQEEVGILERAIDRLPETYRAVLMLRDVQQLSTEEVAAVLGISDEAVRIRVHRARRALRHSWDDELRERAPAAFPFHAPRCDRVVAAVMAEILR